MIHQRNFPIEPEPIFDEQYYTYDSQFSDKQNKAISMVAGAIHTINKIAAIKEGIEKVSSISQYIPEVSTLKEGTLNKIIDNLDLLTSENYKGSGKSIMQILIDKPTQEELLLLNQVVAALPSILTLTQKNSTNGITPVNAVIHVVENYDNIYSVHQMREAIKNIVALKDKIHIITQSDFYAKMELLTTEDFYNAINGLCYGLDENGDKVLDRGKYYGLAQIHTLFNYLPELLKISTSVNSMTINTTPLTK